MRTGRGAGTDKPKNKKRRQGNKPNQGEDATRKLFVGFAGSVAVTLLSISAIEIAGFEKVSPATAPGQKVVVMFRRAIDPTAGATV